MSSQMQGQRSILDSLSDTMDLNQGPVTSSNSNPMNHSAALDNLLNPVENRLSNYILSSGESSVGCTSISSHNARRISGWDAGESSSDAQDHMHTDLKIGQGCSTSITSCATLDAMQEDKPEQSGVRQSEGGDSYNANHVNRRPQNMSITGPYHCSRNVDLNSGYMGTMDHSWQGTASRCFSSRDATHEELTFDPSAKNLGATSSNSFYIMENSEEAGSSLGALGSSGKRKAFEGSSSQLYPGGSSSAHAQAENVTWHNGTAHLNTTGGFTISPPVCWTYSSQPEQMDPRAAVELRGTPSEIFPPSRINGVVLNSARNVGHQEQDMFSFPSNDAALLSSSSNQPSRSFASSESFMMINSPYHASQSEAMHVPGYSGSMLPYPWNGSFESQSGTSLHPFMLSRGRGTIFRDEQNSRSNLRNNRDVPAEVTSLERRHLVQDSPSSNIALGSSHSSRSLLPSLRSGSSSSMRNLPTSWTADQNLTAHNQQGLTDYAPWTLFPPAELDDGNQRGHFPITPPESSLEAEMLSFSSRRRQHQSSRSGVLMDAQTDAISSWRALAVDLEGRQRLIRQVRNAVRRRDNWRAQDFAFLGPFINGAAELHDSHSDMRLDVDSMSYEELLALEERIGNVSTGLNEEMIMKSMNQRKYQSTGSSSTDESCCICRDEYVSGDDIGTVACGHEFHTECIKQWLLLKNLCPICKTMALET